MSKHSVECCQIHCSIKQNIVGTKDKDGLPCMIENQFFLILTVHFGERIKTLQFLIKKVLVWLFKLLQTMIGCIHPNGPGS